MSIVFANFTDFLVVVFEQFRITAVKWFLELCYRLFPNTKVSLLLGAQWVFINKTYQLDAFFDGENVESGCGRVLGVAQG